jgi:hypothetical protein
MIINSGFAHLVFVGTHMWKCYFQYLAAYVKIIQLSSLIQTNCFWLRIRMILSSYLLNDDI